MHYFQQGLCKLVSLQVLTVPLQRSIGRYEEQTKKQTWMGVPTAQHSTGKGHAGTSKQHQMATQGGQQPLLWPEIPPHKTDHGLLEG